MKLYFLKESALASLKKNIKKNTHNYKNKTNEWVYAFFDGETPFAEFKYNVKDFELDVSSQNLSQSNINNIKILYENLKFLTDSQASDERLWAGLAHGQFWDYMQYRVSLQDKEITSDFVLFRFFLKHPSKKYYDFNFLARLWWIGRLTYDTTKQNPYELTEYLMTSGFNIQYMLGCNFISNFKITRAVLSSCKDFESKFFQINRHAFDCILAHLNLLGGKYVLDYFEEQEIYNIVTEKLTGMTILPDDKLKYTKKRVF